MKKVLKAWRENWFEKIKWLCIPIIKSCVTVTALPGDFFQDPARSFFARFSGTDAIAGMRPCLMLIHYPLLLVKFFICGMASRMPITTIITAITVAYSANDSPHPVELCFPVGAVLFSVFFPHRPVCACPDFLLFQFTPEDFQPSHEEGDDVKQSRYKFFGESEASRKYAQCRNKSNRNSCIHVPEIAV